MPPVYNTTLLVSPRLELARGRTSQEDEVRGDNPLQPSASQTAVRLRGGALQMRRLQGSGHWLPLQMLPLRLRFTPPLRHFTGRLTTPLLPQMHIPVPSPPSRRRSPLLQRLRQRRRWVCLPLHQVRFWSSSLLRESPPFHRRRRRDPTLPLPQSVRAVPSLRRKGTELELPLELQELQPPRVMRHGHADGELARDLLSGESQRRTSLPRRRQGARHPRRRAEPPSPKGEGSQVLRDGRLGDAVCHLRRARGSHRHYRRRCRLPHFQIIHRFFFQIKRNTATLDHTWHVSWRRDLGLMKFRKIPRGSRIHGDPWLGGSVAAQSLGTSAKPSRLGAAPSRRRRRRPQQENRRVYMHADKKERDRREETDRQ